MVLARNRNKTKDFQNEKTKNGKEGYCCGSAVLSQFTGNIIKTRLGLNKLITQEQPKMVPLKSTISISVLQTKTKSLNRGNCLL